MSEPCHLKDCGREAVIGTMEKWGPEYRVAMCEHHVMERLARLPAALEALEEAQGERDALMKAGVTDYSKFTGTNRVDCHFCNGVWRTEDSAKHKSTCPLGRILSKEGE